VIQPSLFGSTGGGAATANVDGGSRGNPGPAGYGVRIEREDGSVVELKDAVGVATNNIAEYRGLLAALEWAVQHAVERLHVRSDSQLLVKQMLGEYRVKNAGLQPLYEEARTLARRLRKVTFEHVPRERNADADRLANEAMDEAASRV
jgi:probable phosphoglycerate mutase